MPAKKPVVSQPLGKEKFGTQASTSIKCRFFRNGDKHHKGEDVVLDPRRFNSLEKLRLHLDKTVTLSTGPVLSIKTTKGKKITSMDQFEEGANYFAIGGEGKINKDNFPLVLKKKASSGAGKTSAAKPRSSAASHHHSPVVHGSMGKQKFGTQASTSIKCRFFRNGDKHHKGEEVVLDPRRFNSLEKLRLHLDKTVTLPTGPVLHIKTTKGKKITSMDQFEEGHDYFAIGGEAKIDKGNFPLVLKKSSKPAREPEHTEEAAPHHHSPVVHGSMGKQKFGTQASTSIKCRFFRNGDKHHQGEEVVLDPRRYNSLEKLRLHLDNAVTLSTGPVLSIKTVKGKKITSMDQFEEGQNYFAVGGEGKIDKGNFPLILQG